MYGKDFGRKKKNYQIINRRYFKHCKRISTTYKKKLLLRSHTRNSKQKPNLHPRGVNDNSENEKISPRERKEFLYELLANLEIQERVITINITTFL